MNHPPFKTIHHKLLACKNYSRAKNVIAAIDKELDIDVYLTLSAEDKSTKFKQKYETLMEIWMNGRPVPSRMHEIAYSTIYEKYYLPYKSSNK